MSYTDRNEIDNVVESYQTIEEVIGAMKSHQPMMDKIFIDVPIDVEQFVTVCSW